MGPRAPPKRGAAAGRWGAALGAALLARGVGGNLSTIAGSEAWAEPPTVTWLHPPKGHVMGGAQVTIYGRGFQQTPYLQAKFASENEVDSVPCRFVGKSEIVCESPVRNSVGTVQVTASNDGITFSGYELVYIRGSGTFLKFVYDNSDPGCLDCLNTPSSGDCALGEGAGGRNCLNPYFVNEVWDVDNATGPYVGGTEVTISAVGLNFPGDPYDLYISSWSSNSGTDSPYALGTAFQYTHPVGGPGTPHPFNVDPNSGGNGPPVTGTFYPHRQLACQFECFLDMDQDGTPETLELSEWLPARWLDYTKIMCVSPPMPVPGRLGEAIADTPCAIRVSNNENRYDTLGTTRVSGSRCPGQCGLSSEVCDGATPGTCEGTFAKFTYQDKTPHVYNIRTAQSSVWPARTPFQGNSEITVVGKNFLPSRYLKCKFGGYTAEGTYVAEDTSHIVGEAGGRARYVSSTEITCVTPTYGPASQREQFPHCYTTAGGREICYPSKVPGSGAVLEVGSFSMGGSISSISVLRAGHGYASSPLVTVVGGGGCCASLNATLDEEGRIASVDVLDGGKNFNMGEGAQLTPVLSGGDGGGSQCLGQGHCVVTSVTVDVGGYDFLAPPQLTFRCPGGGQTCFKQTVGGLECDTTQHSDVSDMARNCQLDGFGVPGRHAEAVAVLGADDHTCHNSFGPCQSQGTIVRVVVTFPGAFYVTHPEIVVTPAAPRIRVVAHEVELRNRNHPSQVGHFSFQGKGPDEYDPTRWNSSSPLDDEAQRSSSFPGGSGNGVQARYPFGAGSVEERGPLLPPLGEAFMDGSIKPGHLALVRVSNNYHRWGVERRADTASGWVRSHHGDRDTEANPPTGYWLWSQDGMTEDEINRCRVSNNPPVHQFSVIQGHGLDAKLGLGTADGEHDVRGDNTGFRYLDGSSVKGAPGLGATAVAVLQSNATSVVGTAGAAAGAGSNCCAIKEIQVTNSGKGYNAPPRVTFRGGGGHGAKARAVVSGGTVLRIELEPYSQGIRYETPPEVIITPAFSPTEYDANVTGSVVGHDVYNLDETSLSAALGRSHGTSNFDVGHGAFPGHPGNRNLGHPQKDCIYLLYSDIYVSPSGSDQTGQGTAARPYRTVQRCIDAALQDPHAYYTYKRADGGDPDPAIPAGGARLGHESRGERVDARDRAYTGWDGTDHGQFGTRQGHTRGLKAGGGSGPTQDAGNAGGNAGTGYSAGYTGRHMRNKPGRTTGWDSGSVARGRGRWEDNTRDSQKGFGYYVNRDRCVLKDGVYRGPGNTDLQPHGRVVQIWAENAGRAVIDCAGAGLGKAAFREDRHDEASATRVGSVTLQGVLSKNCRARADFAAHHRDYYVGRPGYGPGARHLNGDYCWPGKTGCQTRRGGAVP